MLEKLLSNTKKNGDCLEWLGCYNTDGYPRKLYNGNSNGKVHRIVFELVSGQNIDGLLVRHSCDNPECINPNHLSVGTPTDNMLDRQERRRTHSFMSNKEFQEILDLRKANNNYTEIGKILGISKRRVEYALIKRARK